MSELNEDQVRMIVLNAGCHVEAADGTFLGKLASKYNQESISNDYGQYGSKYAQTSMFNEYSPFGSAYSQTGAFNKYAQEPPRIVLDGKLLAYVTVNEFKTPRIDPQVLRRITLEVHDGGQ